MFPRKKNELNVDQFWKDYETKTGETVLARSLGKYMSGLAEQPQPLWGLVIATSGGFRFHHFPHEGWLLALSRISTGGEAPKEKTFFIPRNDILSVVLSTEKRWWKRLLTPSNPLLIIRCRADNEKETSVIIETDQSAAAVAEALQG